MFLKGERVRLRPTEQDDLKDLFAWFNNPEAWGEYEDFRPIDWFAFEKSEKERESAPEKGGRFIIERNEGRVKIGVMVHFPAHRLLKGVEIGYAITQPQERGKGYATEALGLLVDYLFNNQDIQRIQATSDTRNDPSHMVLTKCGFKKEGELRKVRFVGGAYRNYYIYSLLREEWKSSQ